MTSKEYEKVVTEIVQALYEIVEGKAVKVAWGSTNKWEGASTYFHQIDVSIEGPKDIILVECKDWNTKVTVPALLTFLARVSDIMPIHKAKQIHSKVVTTVGFDPGVEILSAFYKIDLHKVRSANEFTMQFKSFGMVGMVDSFTLTDELSIEKNIDTEPI